MTQSLVTYYGVKYPDYSPTITIQRQPQGFFRPYIPGQILTASWKEAHDFLKWKAEERVNKARKELEAALQHQEAVNVLQEPST